SFLIDMLNYQPALAKKLFVYDEEKGELKPLMGRAQSVSTAAAASVTVNSDMLSQEVASVVQDAGLGEKSESLTVKLDALATHAALAEQPALAQTARDASAAVSGSNADAAATAMTTLAFAVTPAASVAAESQDNAADFEEDDLRDIFLEEAREVVGNGLEALAALAGDSADVSQLTVLRRAFHTLKGSSRMVGLNEFGEAAWSLEQMLNSWLADQKTATDEFRALSSEAMNGFSSWIADIAANQDGAWSASVFRASADAMRTEARYVPLKFSAEPAAAQPAQSSPPPSPAVEPLAAAVFSLPDLELDAGVSAAASVDLPAPAPAEDLDFDLVFEDAAAAPAAATIQPAALVSEPAAEIEGIDFDSLSAISGGADVSPVAVESAVAEQSAPAAPDEAEAIELSDADFEKHFHAEAAKPDGSAVVFDFAPEPPVVQPLAAAPVVPETFEFAEPVQFQEAPAVEAAAAADNVAEATDSVLLAEGGDEQVKVIGSLRIGIPLYNVYLNEADEWSRRLVTEVAEWSLERNQPVSDSTVALAHSLAGSSATVGFDALSEMARAFEQALQQSRAHHSNGAARYGQIFVDAAEDIRRLLHQFAAGFLKEPDADTLDRLRDLDFSDSILAPGSDLSDFDFSGEPTVETVVDSVLPPELEAELQRQAQPEPQPEPEPEIIIKAEVPEVPAPAPVRAMPVPPPVAVVAPPVRLVTPVAAPAAAPAASQFDEDEDDEIDAVDAIDPDLFPIFEEEAA
ncbi:MAG: Hpt domain-containing protein, partial [Polaromonas sp.]|nr:Hpt domain-containing protein [Polaromonas sp.]